MVDRQLVTFLSTAKLPRPAHAPRLRPCRRQKTNEKKAAPLTKLLLKSNEGALVSRNIYGCCGTREESTRSDSPRRKPRKYYSFLGLIKWEGTSKSKI